MKKSKYYSTRIAIQPNDDLAKLYAIETHHVMFEIVCKATSLTEANNIAEGMGLGKARFHRSYTTTTGNKAAIEAADEYPLVVCVKDYQGPYVAFNEFVSK